MKNTLRSKRTKFEIEHSNKNCIDLDGDGGFSSSSSDEGDSSSAEPSKSMFEGIAPETDEKYGKQPLNKSHEVEMVHTSGHQMMVPRQGRKVVKKRIVVAGGTDHAYKSQTGLLDLSSSNITLLNNGANHTGGRAEISGGQHGVTTIISGAGGVNESTMIAAKVAHGHHNVVLPPIDPSGYESRLSEIRNKPSVRKTRVTTNVPFESDNH